MSVDTRWYMDTAVSCGGGGASGLPQGKLVVEARSSASQLVEPANDNFRCSKLSLALVPLRFRWKRSSDRWHAPAIF